LISLADAARRLDRPTEIAQTTMRLLRETLAADRCAYGDFDPDGSGLTYAAVACAPGVPTLEGRFVVTEAEEGVLLERGPFVIGDPVGEGLRETDRAFLERIGTKALIIVPIKKDGRVAAVAAVHMLSPRRWTADEIELVDAVAERLWESMELARVSRALKNREREYRGLFELSAVGVAQSDPATGCFMRVNHRFCELTGYSEEQLRRKTFSEITHPDDRPANAAAIGKVLRGEAERWDIEKRYVRRDGSVVWAHVSGRAMTEPSGKAYGLIANAVDITDRKHAEAALIASRRQLQLVSDSAPVMLANCGSDYRYKFVNKAYAERYGRSARDIVGRTIWEVLGDDAFAQLKPLADRAIAGERSDFEAEVDYDDLGKRWIKGAYAPEIDETGQFVGWVAAIIDITDRKRAEQTLRDADRRKDEFLAVLGHELRNPLAPLRAGIELLQNAEQHPETLVGLRAMMQRQIGHLIRLVDDLLDLARVTRGDVQLRMAPLDLAQVVGAAVELCNPLIAERGHTLEVAVEPSVLIVEGDFQRLTQVVGNLLGNAAKYTEPGGRIDVRGGIENGRAVVRVKDTGYGIPHDRLEYVFEMFGQVPEHLVKTGGGGIGIGLALARRLVTLHDGTIEARSEGLGHGSEFVVELPLCASASPAPTEASRQGPAARTKRVLVVDDNADAAESLKILLGLEGHSVEVAHRGVDALKLVERFQPHIVLLDIGMPEMDGYEVARRIRALPYGGRIALYALTGWAQEDDKRRALAAGFDDHLTKPVDRASLLELVSSGPRR
jgi:PAS domain S-box-containing protein